MEVTIREAGISDAAAIYAVEKNCFDVPWSEKSVSDFIADRERSFCLVACAGEENPVIGYIGIRYVLDEGDITNIGVISTYRGNGIGTSLLTNLFEECKKRKICLLHLEVRSSNLRAISLYERLGFVRSGQRRGYYADNGEDALLFSKEIREIHK